ncbi:hypothetical protein AX774_g7660 [Zancudomyces culisetae]|uniref:Uncharacterized protein n=1 Tax=Zancudomyces culisetae TaxID=1213189 RepID=A0A1R1PDD6_ZANCU|nr:hypothetical protein AX774_g7660 [Zancudomyces culisetae]|eukprot:OMH78943.1 hypothetical protein AX774_g7660 [Zancudomyces culisetae]
MSDAHATSLDQLYDQLIAQLAEVNDNTRKLKENVDNLENPLFSTVDFTIGELAVHFLEDEEEDVKGGKWSVLGCLYKKLKYLGSGFAFDPSAEMFQKTSGYSTYSIN